MSIIIIRTKGCFLLFLFRGIRQNNFIVTTKILLMSKFLSLFIKSILFSIASFAQQGYQVHINLNEATSDKLIVRLQLPEIKENKALFVIPSVIPGTYMKVNYARFYSNISVTDANGKSLKFKKKQKNAIEIQNAHQAKYISFNVKPSIRDKRAWDNILACAGLIVHPNQSFLLNAQLFTGYIEGYQNLPFYVNIEKPKGFYISTGLQEHEAQSVFYAPNYDELVDNPILVARPDTASFVINNTTYRIANYSDNSIVNAEALKQVLLKTTNAVEDFFNSKMPTKEYTFLFYFQDASKLKGPLASFGLGSALEHRKSSVYYLEDLKDSPALKTRLPASINGIVPHEMLHLLLPLHIRSQEVDNFNFKHPVMSQHIWMYEGFTDYFAGLIMDRDSLTGYGLQLSILAAMDEDKKRNKQVLTTSGQHIIKDNIFNFITKIKDLGNFYQRGKMVALFLDWELFKRSNGTLRLEDVVFKLQQKYDVGKAFKDDAILDEIVSMTYPEINLFFDQYVRSNKPLPYDSLFKYFDFNILPKGSTIENFGNLWLRFAPNEEQIVISKKRDNTLGLKKGDILYKRGDSLLTKKNIASLFYKDFFNPQKGDTVSVTVLRKGREKHLQTSKLKQSKIKYSRFGNENRIASEQGKKRWLAFVRKASI